MKAWPAEVTSVWKMRGEEFPHNQSFHLTVSLLKDHFSTSLLLLMCHSMLYNHLSSDNAAEQTNLPSFLM